ncbi:tctex1 domain-containing protein 1-like [Acipenser oxyrinchus oxyrinchus]|uniref:Tctex1 domain-containing protein 1-like n=1 Tax=Acipenser oxyrinchus oxyrinchus TaxID=40147 RepID=A0AAD8D7M9_ACIOX|nr:tctex1 domain-containing protein 1-like [Acipenser oxyrinchus oxyrinchus]
MTLASDTAKRGARRGFRGKIQQPSVMAAKPSNPQLARKSSKALQATSQSNGMISLKGLLAAQKFTRGLKERTALKLASNRGTGARLRKRVTIIDDQVPDTSSKPKEKFSSTLVDKLMQEYLRSKLEKVSYDPTLCTKLTRDLSEEIKDMVKKSTPPRYKLVCVVTLGKKANEDAVVASRCLWDSHADNFTSYTYQNRTLFCIATVFAVYSE